MALGLGRLDEEGEFGGNATASDTASLRSYGAKSKARQVKVDFTVVQQDCDQCLDFPFLFDSPLWSRLLFAVYTWLTQLRNLCLV